MVAVISGGRAGMPYCAGKRPVGKSPFCNRHEETGLGRFHLGTRSPAHPQPPQVPSATTIAFLTAPRNVSIELIQRG